MCGCHNADRAWHSCLTLLLILLYLSSNCGLNWKWELATLASVSLCKVWVMGWGWGGLVWKSMETKHWEKHSFMEHHKTGCTFSAHKYLLPRNKWTVRQQKNNEEIEATCVCVLNVSCTWQWVLCVNLCRIPSKVSHWDQKTCLC